MSYNLRMIKHLRKICNIIMVVVLSSCSSLPAIKSVIPITAMERSELERQTLNIITVRPVDYSGLEDKIEMLRRVIKEGKALSVQSLRLYDELFATYVDLKSTSIDNVIKIPAHSRKRMPIQTFCLNPNFAGPSKGERFVWRTDNPEFPYFREVMKYSATHPRLLQSTIQSLLWNLKRETNWESYPKDMQSILLSIDPQAPYKLPSAVKKDVKSKMANVLTNKLKEWGIWQQGQAVQEWIKGEYKNFVDAERQFLSLKSKFPILIDDTTLATIPSSPLYAETLTESYSNHIITFFNPTDKPVEINLTQYYMISKRPDVQRMAMRKIVPPQLTDRTNSTVPGRVVNDGPVQPEILSDTNPVPPTMMSDVATPQIVKELESVLYDDIFRLGIGFIPVIGDAADLYELVQGKDFTNGQTLSWQERLLSGIGLVVGDGVGYRYALRAVHAPAQYMGAVEKELTKILGKEAHLNKEGISDAKLLLEQAGDEVNGLKNILKKEDLSNKVTASIKEERTIGYHATRPESASVIESGGFIPSSKGRLGGNGVYVNSTPEGALAEYNFHNPNGPPAKVLKIEYKPGLEYKVEVKQDQVTGAIPLKADTLTTESVRSPGTYNSIVRNGSEKVIYE